ncbi:MAG: glycerol-3-phosphate dehydrogenase/oxidase [Asgard group archaeon]|nr:glycerol-3-phosphate dehydrogenase/oxidase [Asgard group archaeon]
MTKTPLEKRQKDLEQLRNTEFDILVIGGGITGAGVAWDAALRGLSVALIEKIDFGFGTSGGSSKLVHAGIRYLAYGEFGLVHTASKERKWMYKSCPHLTEPVPFIIPNYKDRKNSFLKLFFGGWMYDLLACFKNTENHKFISKEETVELVPKIKRENLKRSLFYYDGIMDDARVTLETILAAQQAGAITVNYVEAIDFEVISNNNKKTINHIVAKNNLTDETFTISAKMIINAAGPWTDKVLNLFSKDKPKRLSPSKGIHIITHRLIEKKVVLVVTADDDRGMFVIPFQDNYSLIGTTDTFYDGDLDHVEVTQEDVDYVISAVNNDLPGTLTQEDIISAYSGIRPLIISSGAESETETSRDYEIFENAENMLTITGGKYTIFRHMAEKVLNQAIKKLGFKKKNFPCVTKNAKLHGANRIDDFHDYQERHLKIITAEFSLDKDIIKHLLSAYGICHTEILELIQKDPSLANRIAKGRPYILAEIPYIINNEMCFTLTDFMMRRTQLQLMDNQGLDCINKISKRMGEILNWTPLEIEHQIEDYKNNLVWRKNQ